MFKSTWKFFVIILVAILGVLLFSEEQKVLIYAFGYEIQINLIVFLILMWVLFKIMHNWFIYLSFIRKFIKKIKDKFKKNSKK